MYFQIFIIVALFYDDSAIVVGRQGWLISS